MEIGLSGRLKLFPLPLLLKQTWSFLFFRGFLFVKKTKRNFQNELLILIFISHYFPSRCDDFEYLRAYRLALSQSYNRFQHPHPKIRKIVERYSNQSCPHLRFPISLKDSLPLPTSTASIGKLSLLSFFSSLYAFHYTVHFTASTVYRPLPSQESLNQENITR